jgi:hypothetical protein
MLSPLIPDIKHPKWIIAFKILEIIGSPRAKKVASKLKIYDIDNFLLGIKILVLSDLFEREISNLVSEINHNYALKKQFRVRSEIKAKDIYELQSKLDYESLYVFLRRLFQNKKRRKSKKQETIIIDTSSVVIDLNIWRNKHKIGKQNKKYKYSYCPSIGYYVGYKLILAINQNYEILGFEIHDNSPNDSKMLLSFVEKLDRSGKIKQGDIILCDRGFTSKKNYQLLINRFYLIPIIYPKKNTNLDGIFSSFNPPLDAFSARKYKLRLWMKIVSHFKKLIVNWENFRQIRSKIEDFFNIAKNSLGMKRNHQYTKVSVQKKVSRIVFLTQKLIHLFDELNIEIKAIPFW